VTGGDRRGALTRLAKSSLSHLLGGRSAPPGGLRRDTAASLLAIVVVGVSMVSFGAVVGRVRGVEALGQAGLGLAVGAGLAQIVGAGIVPAITRFSARALALGDLAGARRAAWGGAAVLAALGFSLAATIFLSAPLWAPAIGLPPAAVWPAAALAALEPGYLGLKAALYGAGAAATYARVELAGGLGFAFALAMLASGLDVPLLAPFLAADLVFVALAPIGLWRALGADRRRAGAPTSVAVALPMLRYALLAGIGTAAALIRMRLPPVVAGASHGAAEVGLLQAALVLLGPALLLPRAVELALFPALAGEHGRADARAVAGRASRATAVIAGSLAGVSGGLIVTAPWLLVLLDGPAFRAAAPALVAVVAGAWVVGLATPAIATLASGDRIGTVNAAALLGALASTAVWWAVAAGFGTGAGVSADSGGGDSGASWLSPLFGWFPDGEGWGAAAIGAGFAVGSVVTAAIPMRVAAVRCGLRFGGPARVTAGMLVLLPGLAWLGWREASGAVMAAAVCAAYGSLATAFSLGWAPRWSLIRSSSATATVVGALVATGVAGAGDGAWMIAVAALGLLVATGLLAAPGVVAVALIGLLLVQDAVVDGGAEALQYADEALLLLALAGVVAHACIGAVRGRSIPWTPIDLPLLVFVGVLVASAMANGVPPIVAGAGGFSLARGPLAFALVARLSAARDPERSERLALAAAGVVALAAALAVVQRLLGEPAFAMSGRAAYHALWSGSKAPGWFSHHNALGHASVLALCALFGIWIAAREHGDQRMGVDGAARGGGRGRRQGSGDGGQSAPVDAGDAARRAAGAPADRRKLEGAVLCIGLACGAGLIASASRESWLACAAAAAAVAVAGRSRPGMRLAAAAVAVLAVGGTAVYGFSEGLREEMGRRWRGVWTGWSDYDLGFTGWAYRGEYRVYALRKSLEIFHDNAWLGVGPGRFGGSVAQRFGSPIYELYAFLPLDGELAPLDLFWARLPAEIGVLGAATYLLAAGVALSSVWRLRRAEAPAAQGLALGAVGALVALAVLGFFSPALEEPAVAIPAFALAGAAWRGGTSEAGEAVRRGRS